jgi:hypothetical protein
MTYTVWGMDADGDESLLITGLNAAQSEMLVRNLADTFGGHFWREEE